VVDLVVLDSTNANDLRRQPYITSRWMSPDPLAEKYYEISPYTYCANDPIKFIDPTGEYIIINYGDNQTYRYNGDASDAPDNEYVKQVIAAYNAMKEKGGSSFVDLVNDKEKGTNIFNAADYDKAPCFMPEDVTESTDNMDIDENGNITGTKVVKQGIYWQADVGSETKEGVVFTPLETLEGEANHAYRYLENPEKYSNDQDEKHQDFGNMNEYYAHGVAENNFAIRNSGNPNNIRITYTGSKTVVTGGLNSRIINRKKTEELKKKIGIE
jgi:hypothetical protein